MVGDVMFYGAGAGKLPTASAVVADIMDCARHIDARKYLSWQDGSDDYVAAPELDTVRLYVRGSADSYDATVSEINSVFADAQILKRENNRPGEIAFVTDEGVEKDIIAKLDSLMNLKTELMLHIVK